MGRKRTHGLTPRELQLMEVLWRLETPTAEEVREALPGVANDSTVRTMLRVLVSKGFAATDDAEAPRRFRPLLAKPHAEGGAVRTLLAKFFGGSAESLVLRMVEDELLDPDSLRDLLKQTRSKRQRGR